MTISPMKTGICQDNQDDFEDDFEIEVHDLRENLASDGDESSTEARRVVLAPLPARLSSLSPLVARLTMHQKLRRGLAIVGVVLAACLALLAVSPALRGALNNSQSAADESLPPGSEAIYVEAGVPWGILTVDGKHISSRIVANGDSFALTPGMHSVSYIAPPFAPLYCRLHVPYSKADTCPLEFAPPAVQASNSLFVRIINLGATPDRLSPDQAAALVRVADGALHALATSVAVPPGSYYLKPDRSIAQTVQPLVATLHFRINDNAHLVVPYLPGGALCSQICYVGQDSSYSGAWALLAMAQVRWSYTTPDGTVLLPEAPASTLANASIGLLTLDVNWHGFWQAKALPYQDQFGANPVCDLALYMVPPAPALKGAPALQVRQEEIALPHLADGCLIVTRFYANNTPVAGGDAHTLYRFGVLLAANARAHSLWPQLPLATKADQQFAATLATTPGRSG